ncbi:MAG: hypothetical protein DYG94_07610 [Leptolyngbya sp. PLA3]|nr:MAG: hypothetical protein EDM82_10485 [Cyanobacteria bacterium CYA]MCE7968597.1 hypothetical protein [Leptolyngbya sp. PL-A3]
MSASLEEIRAAIESCCDPDRTPFSPVSGGADSSECRLVCQLVYSFMLWESSLSRADKAMSAISGQLLDVNELRVCLPSELMSIIGPRYPRAEERCLRLRACLNAVFEHEHRTSLATLEPMSKREARSALESLEGMVPFVAARVVLVELGGHCFPVDSRIAALLGALCEPDESHASLSGKLERAFRAGEIPAIYAAIERRLEARPAPRAPSRPRKSGSRTP